MLSVDVRKKKSEVVVFLSGELDCKEELPCREALNAASTDISHQVIIDLSGITFMDSTGIKLLLEADRRARRNGLRRPKVRGASAQVMRIFNLTGITAFLNIESDTTSDPRSLARRRSSEHPSLWGGSIAAD